MFTSVLFRSAEGESPDLPSPVARVTATPPMVTVSLACTVKVPAAELLMVTVQMATLPLIDARSEERRVGKETGTPRAPKLGVQVADGEAGIVAVKISLLLTSLACDCGM